MDLLAFATIAWYQVNYRTTTVRQASRRSWRIGQKEPVTVYHLVYGNTVQAAALGLIAKKVHSSNLFDGDLSAGGLDDMVEDESLVALAKQLLEDVPQDGGLEELFANRELTARTEEGFIDAAFVPEIIPAEPDRERRLVAAPATLELFTEPVLTVAAPQDTLTRFLDEHNRIRAEEMERTKLVGERRRQVLVDSGQLVLFPEAA